MSTNGDTSSFRLTNLADTILGVFSSESYHISGDNLYGTIEIPIDLNWDIIMWKCGI